MSYRVGTGRLSVGYGVGAGRQIRELRGRDWETIRELWCRKTILGRKFVSYGVEIGRQSVSYGIGTGRQSVSCSVGDWETICELRCRGLGNNL